MPASARSVLRRLKVVAFATLLCAATSQAKEPPPPSVMLEQGRHAGADTRLGGAEKWGLVPLDFSTLDDEALLEKAGVAGRPGEVKIAAELGDAYAQYLFGTWEVKTIRRQSLPDVPGREMFELAAAQGLVRAVSRHNFQLALLPNAEGIEALAQLAAMARTGNAYSQLAYGLVLTQRAATDADRVAGRRAIWAAADQGLGLAVKIRAQILAAESPPAPSTGTAPALTPVPPERKPAPAKKDASATSPELIFSCCSRSRGWSRNRPGTA